MDYVIPLLVEIFLNVIMGLIFFFLIRAYAKKQLNKNTQYQNKKFDELREYQDKKLDELHEYFTEGVRKADEEMQQEYSAYVKEALRKYHIREAEAERLKSLS